MHNTDFQTPDWVCDIMTELILGYPETILEPTPGAGNLFQSISKRLPKSIIYAPKHFEEFNIERVDLIVANPPFTPMSQGYQLLDRFFDISDNIIILMPWLALINSESRTKRYIDHGLKEIHHLPRRAFPGSRVQACILVFQKGYNGEIRFKSADGQLPMRAYIVSDSEHETNIAVIAPDSLTAKKYGASELFDCDWIDLRVRSAVGANVSGLKEGVFEDLREALRIGIFHCIEGEYCDICGHEGIVRMLNDQIVCSGCFEEVK